MEKLKRKEIGVTLRAIVVGLILTPLNCFWVITGEMKMGANYMLPTFIVPFYNVIFCLFFLTLLSFLLDRFLPSFALSQGELLTVYIILSLATCLPAIHMMGYLVTGLGHLLTYATAENEWQELFIKRMPKWVIVDSESVLTSFSKGESTLYTRENLISWVQPALIWSSFATVLVFVMLCINSIFRKQWIESEKLSYPVVYLPFEMTSRGGNLFLDKPMLIGFAIAGSIVLINGFSFLYPNVPFIHIHRRHITNIFISAGKPWSAMTRGGFLAAFYPFAIGLSFLMPIDLSFSCWFFYLLRKFELVLGSIFGWYSIPRFPYSNEQAFGGAIAFVIAIFWMERRYLKSIFLRLFLKENSDISSDEPMSKRAGLIGIVIGISLLVLFSVKIGMSAWLALSLFVGYYLLSIVVTRIRAESGFFTHPMEGIMIRDIIITCTGTRVLGASNLTVMALYRWFNYGFSPHPMPHQMEGLKLSQRAGMNSKRLAYVMIFFTFISALSVFWVLLHLFYKIGSTSGGGWADGGAGAIHQLRSFLLYPTSPDYTSVSFMGIGALFSFFLMIMRFRFVWWTFHPIGYIIANLNWGAMNFWSCQLIGSTAKWVVFKYGGARAYSKGMRVAIGLILGDFVIGGLWNVIGFVFLMPTYSFWPGGYIWG